MGQLQNNSSTLSWGAVDDYKKVQTLASTGVAGAIGDTATRNAGGFSGFFGATTSIASIDTFFTNAEGGNDTAGLNTDGIPTIINAVNNYVAAIDKEVNSLENADVARKAAFKGEVDTAVGSFINSVREHLVDVSSHLKKFNGRLEEVSASYQKASSDMASDITGQAQGIAGSVDRFAE